MKLITSCSICSAEFQRKYKEETGVNTGSVPGYCCVEYVVNEENFYELTCLAGHEFSIIYNEEKYELLFKAGIAAFEAGYFREAVSSIAASIERFYEFLIRLMCLSEGITQADIDNTWKEVRSQSERQLGSYIYLYLINFKSKPELIVKKFIELRNSVIHKGIFPSKHETFGYIDYVLKYYYETLEAFKKQYSSYLTYPYEIRENDYKKKYLDQNVKFYHSSLFNRFSLHDQKYTVDEFIAVATTNRYIRENWERKIQYYTL